MTQNSLNDNQRLQPSAKGVPHLPAWPKQFWKEVGKKFQASILLDEQRHKPRVNLSDFFTVQNELALAIAKKIRIRVSSEERARLMRARQIPAAVIQFSTTFAPSRRPSS